MAYTQENVQFSAANVGSAVERRPNWLRPMDYQKQKLVTVSNIYIHTH